MFDGLRTFEGVEDVFDLKISIFFDRITGWTVIIFQSYVRVIRVGFNAFIEIFKGNDFMFVIAKLNLFILRNYFYSIMKRDESIIFFWEPIKPVDLLLKRY